MTATLPEGFVFEDELEAKNSGPELPEGFVFEDELPKKPFKQRAQEATLEAGKEAVASPLTGAAGAYGNIQNLLFGQLPNLTPRQALQAKMEQQVPEELLPFLQEENLAPEYAALPTTEKIRELLGIKAPQTTAGKLVKRIGQPIGEIAGLGLPVGAGEAGLFALGGGLGQAAEEMGAGPGLQTAAEIAPFLASPVKEGLKALKGAPEKLSSGISKLRGIEPGKTTKLLQPTARASSIEKAKTRLITEAQDSLSKIKEEALPLSKEMKEGKHVENVNREMLTRVKKVADLIDEPIPTARLKNYIAEEGKRLKASPVPSDEKIEAFKQLKKFAKGLVGKDEILAKDAVSLFRDANQDLSTIYQTRFAKGLQTEKAKTIQGFTKAVNKSIQNDLAGEDAFKNLFQRANERYSQTKKVERFDTLTKDVFDETGKANLRRLEGLVKDSKKSRELQSILGNKGFGELQTLVSDIKKTKDGIQSIKKIGTFSHLASSGIQSYLLHLLGVPYAGAIALKGSSWILGEMLLNPKTNRTVKAFLRELSKGHDKTAKALFLRLGEKTTPSKEKD